MKMDSIIDFSGFIIVKSFSVSLRFVPLGLALWIGRRMGDAVYCFNIKRRMIAYANLKAAFPEKSCMELKRINKAHFENLGMNVIELLKLPFMAKGYLGSHVKLENADMIKSGLDKEKGVIILTAHFGNWEIASLAASLSGYTMSVFAREQKYERLNNLLNEFRQSTGCRVIAKGFSVKDIIKTLHNNGIVAMLSDQDAGANGVFVDFFKRPASTAQGIIAFSAKTGAIIYPSFITRAGIDKHIARVGEPLELVNTGDKEKDLKANLQRIAGILEDKVRKFPEQWLWAHKRWKSTPERNVLVLTDGKAGHFNQAMGVAETVEGALGLRLQARGINEKPIVKIHTAEIKFKNNFTKILLNLAGIFASRRCQGCLKCVKFCLTKESFESVKNKYADIVVSCGSSTTAASVFLKYENNARNAVIMKPGFGRGNKIDLIILPRHDAGSNIKRNVLITEGAPNRITERAVREAEGKLGIAKGDRGGIGILIGGNARGFELKKEDVVKAINGVMKICEEKDLDMFISTSRRTSAEIDRLLKETLSNNKRCKLLIIANEKNTEGAVAGIFGLSDIVAVTPESMSMISEAASSGKSVIVFSEKLDTNKKYAKMVLNLASQGYARTARPDEVYNRAKEILETKPGIKKLNDRDNIEKRLAGLI